MSPDQREAASLRQRRERAACGLSGGGPGPGCRQGAPREWLRWTVACPLLKEGLFGTLSTWFSNHKDRH